MDNPVEKFSDDKLRKEITGVRTGLSQMRHRINDAVLADEQGAFKGGLYNPENAEFLMLLSLDVKIAEALYMLYLQSAVDRGMRVPKWEGDKWHWNGEKFVSVDR